jgi:hypothetical protein
MTKTILTLIAKIAVILSLAGLLHAAERSPGTVDFRFSPPEWQTAICLPDDPHKSLVDRSGELLYHYRQGGREFGTRVGVEVASGAAWQKQEVLSPRVPIVRTFRTAEGLEIVEEAFAVTDLPQPAAAQRPLRRLDVPQPDGPSRNDLILVRVTNRGSASRTLQPQLVVDTTLGFAFQPETQSVRVGEHETVTASLKMTGLAEGEKSRRAIALEALIVPPGKSVEFFVLYSAGGSIVLEPRTVKGALASRRRAVKFWERAPLPFGRVQVPDAGVQALVDSSIRNIWQAREIKRGQTVFQVGPTCYRGLWIVDGSFLLEAAAILGAGADARSGVAYELSHQRPDGRIEVMDRYYKENGIVLWTCVRHALLTQDRAWLESVWPNLEKAAGFIKELRALSRTNDTPLDDGLNPPGEIDGGLSGQGTKFKRPEFSNVHWNLLGLRAFVQAAHWLGKADAAARWQSEFDDLKATFRQAAARDLRKDSHGNNYVPIFMANEGSELPQRAQWTFCHAVYPGQIFAKDDPLVASTMAMLEATERQGMVCGTGWDAAGIWNYFASFYGHAWLWQGNGRKAAQVLTAFANHAAPTLVWREEQSLKGEPFKKVGDMPHNWASAEFIRLTVHLLALDRGDELHLLEGFPREWAAPGMVTRLDGVATPFGPLHLEVKADKKGESVTVSVKPVAGNCHAVVAHLPDGGTRTISPQKGGSVAFPIRPARPPNHAGACEPPAPVARDSSTMSDHQPPSRLETDSL